MPEITTASLDDLLHKPKRVKTITLKVPGEDDEERLLKVKLQAIGSSAYDELVAAHPPKSKDRGSNFDADSFGPALLAASFVEPALSPEDAKALWHSEEWSGGEILALFNAALDLNLGSMNVPFNENG